MRGDSITPAAGKSPEVKEDSPLQAEEEEGVQQGGGEEKDGAYLPYVVEAESVEGSAGLQVWVNEKMQAEVLAGLAFSRHVPSFVLRANLCPSALRVLSHWIHSPSFNP